MQETDQNYGQFKSLLRKYIQLLLNEQYAQYKRCQQENLPCKPPNLNRSHYGILLGGRPADEENGIKEIPPIFALSFSKEKNLRSWEICGACPLTRAPMHHRSLCLEVEADLEEQQGDILVQYHESSEFDWASHSASELEKLNHTACQWLSDRGYNASSLKVKSNFRSRNFDSRIPKDAPVEERVKAIVKSGILLNSLMYTIGPSCLSSDEIFQAFEYRELLKVYNTAKKDRAAFDKKKKLETSAKALLALNKTTYTMSEKQLLLRWKLGDE